MLTLSVNWPLTEQYRFEFHGPDLYKRAGTRVGVGPLIRSNLNTTFYWYPTPALSLIQKRFQTCANTQRGKYCQSLPGQLMSGKPDTSTSGLQLSAVVGVNYLIRYTVADLHSKILDAPGSKFFQFLAVFLENFAKWYVGAPLEGWRPPLQRILDYPIILLFYKFCAKNYMKMEEFGPRGRARTWRPLGSANYI